MINITISSQLCDIFAGLCQVIVMIPNGALYSITRWAMPPQVVLVLLFIFLLLVNNLGMTLEFSAIHKVKLTTIPNGKLAFYLYIKGIVVSVANIIGIFFVIGSSLYYQEICMGTYQQCQETIEMQRYFLLIFLLQALDVFICIILPCALLALAILGFNFLPESLISSPSIFLYLHSASNSVILILSTESYRNTVKRWFSNLTIGTCNWSCKRRKNGILVAWPLSSTPHQNESTNG
ncbi:unnamed protein product, partial [Mesorhabditis belari]|uniref:Uncharacterized protein n=1 Tax=Mesorhabditis belari TaxID=2138241 RepID=A0AAF3F7G5_9BILA